MARDYKRKRKPAKKKADSSPWMFLASGFGLGLVAALVLYLQMRPAQIETPNKPIPNSAAAPQSSIESEPAVVAQQRTPEPVEKTAAKPSAVPVPVRSNYDFYKVLPDFEVVIADENNKPVAAKPSAKTPTRPAQKAGEPENYILQAGSFRKFVDADRRKAELAFKGIESNIQQVVLKEEEIWYRVYVGPSTDFVNLENMRSTLRRANIDVLILKVRT